MVTAVSPFTGSKTDEVWGCRDNQSQYLCPDTGALFFDRNLIQPDDYVDYYPYLDDFDDERFEWELSIRRKRYSKQLSLMSNYSPGKSLLDIGAGPGYLCRIAEDCGWTAFAVEPSSCAVRYGSEKLGTKYRDLEDIPEDSIDAITCHHVFEHVADPSAFLRTMHNKLKDNGLLVIHVPHQEPLTFKVRNILSQILGRDHETLCALYGNEHLSGFTKHSLQQVMQRHEFGVYFLRTAGMWTKYYDPFFFRSYLRDRNWMGLGKSFARHTVENLGIPFGCGDWVIGYFNKI